MRQSLTLHRAACPHDCPDTCSILVGVDPDTRRAETIRGNPDHANTAGFLCAKVNHYLERVYHADRLTTPLRRTGPKGSGEFTPISWTAAIEAIVDRFQFIAQGTFGPQSILPYSYAGTMGKIQGSSLDRRFFHVLGASLLDRTICATAGSVGSEVTFGAGGRAAIDPARAVDSRYIINWGSNTVVTNVHFWKIQHEARQRGAKIVTIDPFRSPTAAKSDWWIPIRPGTDAALALGLMHILFRDGLEDQDYLEKYCLGSAELRQRALAEYPPEKVAGITGLSIETIEQLAREYGHSRQLFGGPALIRLNYGLQRHGGGGMAVRTITCLPAITGDWRFPGAGALLSTSKQYAFNTPALERPDLIPPGTRTVNMVQLAEALHGELPGPPVQALYVYNSNPASVAPDQSRVLSGLQREDLFTVVHDLFLTDTARYADIVLPATSQLEHFDIHNSYGHLDVLINAPCIPPLGEALPNTEVFRRLASKLNLPAELFQQSDEELAAESIADHPRLEGITVERLLAEGPIRLNLPEPFAPYAQGGFPTPSGKCHLSSPSEAAAGRDPLPYYIPPHEDPQTKPALAAKFPLQLLSPPASTFLNSTFANIEHLRKQAGVPTVMIHPLDAEHRAIQTGHQVRVRNDRGQYEAMASVTPDVKKGVVVATGLWWNRDTPNGRNINTTTSTAVTDFGGGATFFDNLVEVELA
ncbi:MAG: molybdopterin-containing oxidoreductase family protein [Gemmataceae bacterium]